MLKRINIDLPEGLWKRVGILAIQEDKDKRVIVIEALEDYLKKAGGKR